MHREAREAFLKMAAAAKKEGIAIEVVSAYRSFERQKQIFERKYRQFTKEGDAPIDALEKIIEYSTIPGTSRHHWGTDLDLIDGSVPRPSSVLEAEHFHGTGVFCKLKAWMDAHANEFDFFEVYTDNGRRKGFAYEPWHFSYAPVSRPMLAAYRNLNVGEIIREEQLLGAQYFSEAFIERYRNENILDINPELLS
jgi:LAS superfamily LD-carboxypeptidase LdcB